MTFCAHILNDQINKSKWVNAKYGHICGFSLPLSGKLALIQPLAPNVFGFPATDRRRIWQLTSVKQTLVPHRLL